MERALYAGSMTSSLFLVAGSVWFPDGAGMWLASTSVVMDVARLVVALLMAGLIFMQLARIPEVRMLFGVVALGFTAWAIGRAFDGTVMVVDAMVFLLAGISFGVAALEAESLAPVVRAEPLSIEQLFAVNFHKNAGTKGVVVPRAQLTKLSQQLFIMAAVMSGMLYQNLRPYRALWRGS